MTLATISVITAVVGRASADEVSRIWHDLYFELNPTHTVVEDPLWVRDVYAWAQREQARIEPILVDILSGQRDEIPWRRGIAVVRAIHTQRVRDALYERVSEIMNATRGSPLSRESAETDALLAGMHVFARVRDERMRRVAEEVIGREGQLPEVLRVCLEVLRLVGNQESVAAIRAVQGNLLSKDLENVAALAEKVIEARLAGRDVFVNAQQELRLVTAQFVRALEERDFATLAAVQPYSFREVVNKEKFTREILPRPEWGDILRALKRIAGREEFAITRDDYEATLIVEGRYQFTYVLEVDGWKISGPIRVGP